MIYLITGTPGDGKSLRAVWYAEQFLREGRAVFGNIRGYARQAPIPGMSPLVKDKDGRWSGGVGGDWRLTPNGSVVIYDEAQHDFSQRDNRSAVPVIVRAMETHRHTGHDLIFVTQHPNYIDHWLRRLVGRHDHLRRLGGMNRVSLTTADSVMELPVGVESAAGEKSFWKYPKSLFNAYESATYHTVKHRLPQPVIFMIAICCISVVLGIWAYLHWSSPDTLPAVAASAPAASVSAPAVAASAPAPIPEPDPKISHLLSLKPVSVRPIIPLDEYVAQVASSKSLSGCAESVNQCRCWDIKGDQLRISAQICSALMRHGFPYSIKFGDRSYDRSSSSGS